MMMKDDTLQPDRAASDLSEAELLALWEQARGLARRYCAANLWRLARGAGGFYDGDDFWQDLFLAFWKVARRWQEQPDRHLEELWQRWGRCLWGGGIHILRRAPQRLWLGVELAVDPLHFTLDHLERRREAGCALPSLLSDQALAELVDEQDAETLYLRLRALDDLEALLWRLKPLQRQALFLVALQRTSPREFSKRLGLSDARAACRLLYQARKSLRQWRQAAARGQSRIPGGVSG